MATLMHHIDDPNYLPWVALNSVTNLIQIVV